MTRYSNCHPRMDQNSWQKALKYMATYFLICMMRYNLRQDGRARLSLSTMVNLMILDQATMCLSLGVLDVGSSGTLKYLGSSGIYSLLVMRIFVCCIMAKLAVSN